MKSLTIMFLMTSIGVLTACWFTEDNFNNNYVYAVNSTVHYVEEGSMSDASYVNGGYVAMAGTPYVKVSPRTADQPADGGRDLSVKCCILRYRVFSSTGTAKGAWTTVGYFVAAPGSRPGWTQESVDVLRQSLPEPYATQVRPAMFSWTMDYSVPVTLFGRNSIDPGAGSGLYDGQALQAGDVLILEYYLSDGLFETGDLTEDIVPSMVGDDEGERWRENGRRSFSPPFIFKVRYNGRRRVR